MATTASVSAALADAYSEAEAAWLTLFDTTKVKLTKKSDFTCLLQQSGRNPSRKLIDSHWPAENEQMTFEQFYAILRKIQPQTMNDLMKSFKKIDTNGDGFISHRELKNLLTKRGEKLSDEEVQALMDDADTNRDGKLDYAEFCQMVLSTSKECQTAALKKLSTQKQENEKMRKINILPNSTPIVAETVEATATISEGSDNEEEEEDDLVVMVPSSQRHQLQSKSDTFTTASVSLAVEAKEKLKAKSSSEISKFQNVITAKESKVSPVKKRSKSKVKEPKNLKTWHHVRAKSCFYVRQSNISCHQFRVEVSKPTTLFLSLMSQIPTDVTLFLLRESSSNFEMIDYTDGSGGKKGGQSQLLKVDIDPGESVYHLLPFTSGCYFSHLPSKPSDENSKKQLIDDNQFTLDSKRVLDEIFVRSDLDGDGKLSRKDFNYFQIVASEEECDNETWDIMKENFKMSEDDKLTRKGFFDLHMETVKDEQGNGVEDLWETFKAFGYNNNLDFVNAWCFNFDVYCDQCKPEVSVTSFGRIGAREESAMIDAIQRHGHSAHVKTNPPGIVFHKLEIHGRTTLAVEYNQGSEKDKSSVSVNVDCSGSNNCVSHHKTLSHTVQVAPLQTKIVHHLLAADLKKSAKPKWAVSIQKK